MSPRLPALLALLVACAPEAEPHPPAGGAGSAGEQQAPPADGARLSVVVLEGDGSPASSTTFLRWRERGAEERFADGGELTAVVLREGALVESISAERERAVQREGRVRQRGRAAREARAVTRRRASEQQRENQEARNGAKRARRMIDSR